MKKFLSLCFQKIIQIINEHPVNPVEIIRILPALVTAIGLIIGLYQYGKAQKWKRMEYAASLLNELNTNGEFKLAIKFLDWRIRDFSIPELYQEVANNQKFFGSTYKVIDKDQKFFNHSHEAMARVFDLNNREILEETGDLDLKLSEITLESMIYIDVFDRFFEYFQRINSLINMGLIKRRDIILLNYWADRIWKLKVNQKYVFRKYLEYYKLDGVFKMTTKLSFAELVNLKYLKLKDTLAKKISMRMRKKLETKNKKITCQLVRLLTY